MSIKDGKEKFILVSKRILKENLTTNVETLKAYQTDIVKAYNGVIAIAKKHFLDQRVSDKQREELTELVTYVHEKFVLCLHNLKHSYEFPNNVKI